jgi:succinoglycan biosynthesis protein ExoH
MIMHISKDISDRIDMLRFLMIFGVVILHVPKYVALGDMGDAWFDHVKALFQHALFRATVPVLTMISGYLLFSSTLDRQPLKLWKKKWRSLVMPFIVFNLVVLAAGYFLQSRFGLNISYNLLNADGATWMDAIFGLTTSPINYPLNFLRDMIVLMLLAPALGMLLRTMPVIGLFAVAVCFYMNFDGFLILRDTMPIQFYVGGLAATQKWNVAAWDKYAKGLLALFFLLCVLIVKFKVINRTPFVLVAPILIWPAASLLLKTRLGLWAIAHSKYSFFIFIAHAPVLMLSWYVYGKLTDVIPYEVYWLLTPFFVMSMLVMAYDVGMRVAPGAFAAMIGSRAAKTTAFVERRKAPRTAGAPVYTAEMRLQLADIAADMPVRPA